MFFKKDKWTIKALHIILIFFVGFSIVANSSYTLDATPGKLKWLTKLGRKVSYRNKIIKLIAKWRRAKYNSPIKFINCLDYIPVDYIIDEITTNRSHTNIEELMEEFEGVDDEVEKELFETEGREQLPLSLTIVKAMALYGGKRVKRVYHACDDLACDSIDKFMSDSLGIFRLITPLPERPPNTIILLRNILFYITLDLWLHYADRGKETKENSSDHPEPPNSREIYGVERDQKFEKKLTYYEGRYIKVKHGYIFFKFLKNNSEIRVPCINIRRTLFESTIEYASEVSVRYMRPCDCKR